MKDSLKIALVAAASLAVASSAIAQPTSYSSGDLLLGFTDGNGAHNDLVLDLGPVSGLTAGPVNVGATPSTLSSQLTANYGGIGNANFGFVASSFTSSTHYSTYATVAHGSPAPNLGAPGTLDSAVTGVGQAIGDGSGPYANSQSYNANQGFGFSWTENISGGSSLWQLNTTGGSPDAKASGTAAVVEDLYGRVNTPGLTLLGTLTLQPSGEVDFAPVPVPEPTTYGLIAGLGLLAVTLRRQFARIG